MVYKNGLYTYKSKAQYLNTLGIVFSIFLVTTYFIALMKPLMNAFIYYSVVALGVIMMIHVALKYEYAIGGLKNYIFDEY